MWKLECTSGLTSRDGCGGSEKAQCGTWGSDSDLHSNQGTTAMSMLSTFSSKNQPPASLTPLKSNQLLIPSQAVEVYRDVAED